MVSANFRIINNSDEKSDNFFQKGLYLFALSFIIGEHTQEKKIDCLLQPKVKRGIFSRQLKVFLRTHT